MYNLRNNKIIEIQYKIKESKYFTLDDFEFIFPTNGTKLVEIIFIPFENYRFIIQEAEVKKEKKGGLATSLNFSYDIEDVIQTIESPGNYKNTEKTNYNDIDSCIYKINDWLYNIQSELSNTTININNIANETLDDIKDILNQQFPDDKEVFTKEEIEEITKKLESLQEQVDKLEEELKISKEDNIKIKNIIEQSTSNLSIYPKKSWYFTTLNKFKKINNDINILIELKDNIINMIEYFK